VLGKCLMGPKEGISLHTLSQFNNEGASHATAQWFMIKTVNMLIENRIHGEITTSLKSVVSHSRQQIPSWEGRNRVSPQGA